MGSAGYITVGAVKVVGRLARGEGTPLTSRAGYMIYMSRSEFKSKARLGVPRCCQLGRGRRRRSLSRLKEQDIIQLAFKLPAHRYAS